MFSVSPGAGNVIVMCVIAGGGRRAIQTVPGIPGGTRAGAGKIGRMIAEEVMEIQR